MIKTYITINSLNLTTSVKVSESNIATLHFTGGRRYCGGYVMGRFSTSNKVLQEAIEADSGYGASFVSYTTECDKQEVATHKNTEVNYDLCDMVPGIKNRQDAMLWLQANKGIEIPPTSNVATIKSEAAAAKVVFSDWQ